MGKTRLLITFLEKTGACLGDVLVLSAAIRDLVHTYPEKFEIHVRSRFGYLWKNCPFVTSFAGDKPVVDKLIIPDYGPYLEKANIHKQHFLTAMVRIFEQELQLPLKLLEAKPYVAADVLMNTRPIEKPYYVIVAGGKADTTTKIPSTKVCQQVVDRLVDYGKMVFQCGSQQDIHPRLSNVVDAVGKTGVGDFLRLIKHAECVICPVTAAMHAAAAFDVPCVVLAGGREECSWEAYTNDSSYKFDDAIVQIPHRYLNSFGKLDCCMTSGCWCSKVLKNEFDEPKPHCKYPVTTTYGQILPKCQHMITADIVLDAVLSYQEAELVC